MKVIIYALVFMVALVGFYIGAILLGFNLPKPAFWEKGIEGEIELRVTLLMDNNVKNPLANVEVDLAEKPGNPPKGGVAVTNEFGVATFKVKPDNYYIYFNDLSFPKNLAVPQPVSVIVTKGANSEKTILVTTNK